MESWPDGQSLKEVAVYLTDEEALELVEALRDDYFTEPLPPGWHCHITDSEGNELTVAVGKTEEPG